MKLSEWKGAPLDLKTKPASFQGWQLVSLSGNRWDVRQLPGWAATCETPIDAAAALEDARIAKLYYQDEVNAIGVKLLDALWYCPLLGIVACPCSRLERHW